MALSIKIPGATFTKSIGRAAPDLTGASVFHIFGGTAALSKKNYVGAKADATVIGTPIYAENYVTLSAANGFGSGLVGASPFTYIAIVTRATGTCAYCGNWVQWSSINNILARNAGNLSVATGGTYRANIALADAGFQLVAATHDGTTAKVYLGSGGSLSSASGAAAGGTTPTAEFRVGGTGFEPSGAPTFNCAAVLRFESALSQSRIQEFYDYLIGLCADRGITVT